MRNVGYFCTGMCADAAARKVNDALNEGILGYDQAEEPTAGCAVTNRESE